MNKVLAHGFDKHERHPSLVPNCRNLFGEPLTPDCARRLRAALRKPTQETWTAAASIIINEHGTTLWQAVRRIDPTFPNTGPCFDKRGRRVGEWERIPDIITIARAIRVSA